MTEESEIVVESTTTKSKSQIVNLISRLDHPVYLPYNGDVIVVSPRGRANGLVKNQLGSVPKGILIQEIK